MYVLKHLLKFYKMLYREVLKVMLLCFGITASVIFAIPVTI